MEVEEEVVREEEVEQEEAEGTEEEDVGYKEVNVSVVSHDQDGTQIIHLSAEDVMDDSTASPSMSNPRLKQKQYAQRYRKEWERLDYCKGWLKPHPTNEILGYCKACDRTLHARRNDLRKHALCSKHKKNMELLKAGTPIRRRVSMHCKYPPALLHDQELKGWCVEMPLQRNRVWCRQCRCSLVAQTKALKQHAKSRKHLSNLNERPESPPQPEDQYDDQYHEVDLNYDDAGPSSAGGYESPMPRGGDRAASPLVESDFAGRVTYSIGLGNRKVGFLGAGQIAQAIAQGMLEQGLLLPHDVIVSAPSQRNMLQWKRWKCATTNNNDDVVREADIVFVAVKASVLVRLIGRLTPVSDGKTRLFISLVSGVTRERMTALLSCRVLPIEKMDDSQPEVEVTGPPLHVIRCAPNKMMSISSGFCAYCMGDDVPHSLYLVVETMFSALGTCVQVEEHLMDAYSTMIASGAAFVEEHLMDAYSTMIASGAAFTCAFIEAMVQGGVSLDMGWDEALKVASAVVSGTSKLLMRTSLDPSKLRKSISTPGGSTIIGLAALQRGGLDDAVGKALQLACEKTREVGEAVCGGGGGNSSIAGAGDTSSASITG